MYVCTYVCSYVDTCVCMCISTYVGAYIHTHVCYMYSEINVPTGSINDRVLIKSVIIMS